MDAEIIQRDAEIGSWVDLELKAHAFIMKYLGACMVGATWKLAVCDPQGNPQNSITSVVERLYG